MVNILHIFGSLIDPTDRYSSAAHRKFAEILVVIIKIAVGSFLPASFIVSAYLLWNYKNYTILNLPIWDSSQWTLIGLTLWCLAEIGFYLHCCNLKRNFASKIHFTKLVWAERRFYLQRVLEHNPRPSEALTGWFHKLRDPTELKLENAESWLSWAFFNKLKQDLEDDELHELNDITRICLERDPELANRFAAKQLEDNRNMLPKKKSLDFMKLHLDPIKVQHKPVIAYLVISAMQIYGSIFLASTGFKHHTFSNKSVQPLSYWIYNAPPKSSTSSPSSSNGAAVNANRYHNNNTATKPPVFLVYGIGIGATMYLKVINAIRRKDRSRTIIVLELPHISLKVVDKIPTMDQTLLAIDTIFKKYELTTCNWLGHSYGSIVTTWVIKERPKYVQSVTFVDPVCFALWEPDLINNFLYAKPKGPLHSLAQFFVAKDLIVASTLFRNFWWLQNILFPDDLHCPAHVYFSRYDFIIDAPKNYNYLIQFATLHPWIDLKIEMMEELAHGGFLTSKDNIDMILTHV